MTDRPTIADTREQLKMAHELAKAGLCFVAIPVQTKAAYDRLCLSQAHILKELAEGRVDDPQ